jgi:hypothetical protein
MVCGEGRRNTVSIPLSRELLILDPLRLHGVRPEPPDLVGLVVLEVALEPFDVGVALEGEDVGADAVEEEAVVADDDGAAGEVDEGVLEGAQGLDVEVVGGLVEEEDVAAGAEELRGWTRFLSPPERRPTFFCWSLPLKLKAEQ